VAPSKRQRDIQGLRALAVLLVVAYHAGLPGVGGYLGVDVFFVISGFVITTVLTGELADTGRLRLTRFYRRRVKRLLPALAVMVTVVAALGALASPIGAVRIEAITGIWASVFAANIYLGHLGTGYFDVGANLNPLIHTWTLAVEEQFYLVFPVVIYAAWRAGLRRSAKHARLWTMGAVALVSLASFALAVRTVSDQVFLGMDGQRFAFYAAPARAWEFGAGALLALALPRTRQLPTLLGSALGAAGFGLIGIAIAPAVVNTDVRPQTALLTVAGSCALLAAGNAPANLVSRTLGRRFGVWIGDLSYSWYLWHWPLIVFARALLPGHPWAAPAAAVLSLPVAWLSYRFVENPIRGDSRIRGRVALAFAAACIALPISASVGLVATDDALAKTSALRSWHQVQRLHADVTHDCESQVPLGERKLERCTWRTTRSRGQIVLIGDSNAGHFSEPVIQAGRRAGYDVTIATDAGCPFGNVFLEHGTPDGFAAPCNRFVIRSVRALVRLHPSLVLIAARSGAYVEKPEYGMAATATSAMAHDPHTKALIWERGLRYVLVRLSAARIPVVVVHPVPELPTDSEASAVMRVLLRKSAGSISRAELDHWRRPALLAENRAIARLRGITAVDFENALCGPRICSSTHGHHFSYRDSGHLSVQGALRLTGDFYAAIVANARPATRGAR
jgi:peptidoglycan/LPS O-acetylase OafA/YrhL